MCVHTWYIYLEEFVSIIESYDELTVSVPLGVYTNTPVASVMVMMRRLNGLGVLPQGSY